MVECQANAWAAGRVFVMEKRRLQPIRRLARRSRLDDQSRKRSIAKDGRQDVTTTSSTWWRGGGGTKRLALVFVKTASAPCTPRLIDEGLSYVDVTRGLWVLIVHTEGCKLGVQLEARWLRPPLNAKRKSERRDACRRWLTMETDRTNSKNK